MCREERGSALPFAVACLGLLVLLAGALGVVAAMVRAERQAQAAADLAALAGAQAVAAGRDGCAGAAPVARANDASLTRCAVAGREIRIAVRVRGPRWLGQRGDLDAEARAGPAGR